MLGQGFGRPAWISDPRVSAFTPAIAAREDRVLISWQETAEGLNRVAYAVAENGCVGETRIVEDELPNPRRPAVVATDSGWVLAYEAQEVPNPLIRSIELSPEGEVRSGPETVSALGEVASRVRLAARGNDVVYSWTDVSSHYIARRGPVETLGPTPVGARIEATGLINYPRIALGENGTIYLAYRDGGPQRSDFEVKLHVRKVGEPFGEALNISQSERQMSDDVALTVDPEGRLSVVWVEQDADKVEHFEVVYATLDESLEIGPVRHVGDLGMIAFGPSVTRDLAVAWHAGTPRFGRLFFSKGSDKPEEIMPGIIAGSVSLVQDVRGAYHLAFVQASDPPRLRYGWREGAD
jgi:hypothetical protein